MVPITTGRRRKTGRGLLATVAGGLLRRREPTRDADEGPTPASPMPAAAPTRPAGAATRPAPGRSGPKLAWTDGRVAPKAGSFAPNALANAGLCASSVPAEDDGWDRLNEFALTYDGYAYWENLPELAQRAMAAWARDGSVPETLDEQRACLFYEQRRWHHFGDVPSGRSLRYMWALASEIRGLVTVATPEVAAGAGAGHTHHATEAAGAVSFLDDDDGFLAWMAANPGGVVLNTERTPSSRYLKLHRAACSSFGGRDSDSRSWTVSYRKVCAERRASIDAWCTEQVGAPPDPCRRCRP